MSTLIETTVVAPSAESWIAKRSAHALRELQECVEIDPAKRCGRPVLKGTRMSIAQLLAELGEGRSTFEVADDFGLDAALVNKFVSGLAGCLDRTDA
ncbi:MAG: DUF433 domain-containing protein [Planctomycetaceae bacterium]